MTRAMTRAATTPPVIGIAGWKNSGKTTLATRLIAELTARGFRVSSVKHAHHDFQIDDADTDSARHRLAGAAQVAIVSARRWAVVRELAGEPEPSLEEMIARLDPCDIVLVEGYKAAPIPKIETRRREAVLQRPLAETDPNIIAIATDFACDAAGRPLLPLDDPVAVADFILHVTGLAGRG
ncbi:MAG TPA: molybdopterin-guanine dinucleotide biosynthesis protein B [Hyphomicrobiaceae bacterium]|nr:molybdopterin-guanine dinucleotide biosynthesis protein B [Hyphomicrobiaceae bacterium]